MCSELVITSPTMRTAFPRTPLFLVQVSVRVVIEHCCITLEAHQRFVEPELFPVRDNSEDFPLFDEYPHFHLLMYSFSMRVLRPAHFLSTAISLYRNLHIGL